MGATAASMRGVALLAALAALALGCRREVELTVPRALPVVDCAANGVPCAAASACCSRACADGQCAAAICLGEGEACGAPDDCCSALCGPRAGGETFVCLSPTGCAAAGQPCVRAGDCCDLGCVAGTVEVTGRWRPRPPIRRSGASRG